MVKAIGRVLFPALLLITSLAACNTTAGLGRDLSAAGSALSSSAERAK
jgi:predicted small secreted protein